MHKGYKCETQISWEDFTLNFHFSTGRCNFFGFLSGLRLWGLRSQFITHNDGDERLPDMVINPETCQKCQDHRGSTKSPDTVLFQDVTRWWLISPSGDVFKGLTANSKQNWQPQVQIISTKGKKQCILWKSLCLNALWQNIAPIFGRNFSEVAWVIS